MQMMPKHIFLVHYRQFQLVHAFKVLFYAESVSVVTSGHVTKMAVTPFDLQLPKTSAMRKLYGSTFYRTGVIAN